MNVALLPFDNFTNLYSSAIILRYITIILITTATNVRLMFLMSIVQENSEPAVHITFTMRAAEAPIATFVQADGLGTSRPSPFGEEFHLCLPAVPKVAFFCLSLSRQLWLPYFVLMVRMPVLGSSPCLPFAHKVYIPYFFYNKDTFSVFT